ncbi:DUF636 domain-containing protein [Rhizodiscina lignyota]|uniref:DUF636 domain-containing protein n=1 Tax=Rhizodiscina lignyota TaxID=1504668 RepID=A0A9P4IFE1_9PEZI|nr:DUF636 domain-containing protein [Rhizodiscina lignyota]
MSSKPTRRPYFGSCHCGETKYVAYMTLPVEDAESAHPPASTTIRIRKCNCSTCHKMGFFHLRLKDSPNDFVLLSPLNPQEGGLSNYQCFDKIINWYFCGNCGVRCFALRGHGEVSDIDLESWLGKPSEGKTTKVWRPRAENWREGSVEWKEGKNAYLSVNAATIEPGQEGFDLKEWHEKKWINYLDMTDERKDDRYGEPHAGGCY